MPKNELEATLRLAIARAAEHETEECVVFVSLGPKKDDGMYPFDCVLTHDPVKIERVAHERWEALAGLVGAFSQIHGALPACIMMFHFIGSITVDAVAEPIMETVMEAADLPQPSSLSDVAVWYQQLRKPVDDDFITPFSI